MKIVILDGFTLNPGDLSWQDFNQFGEVKVYDRTESSDDIILDRIGDAEIVFTNKTPLPEKLLNKTSRIKYIGVLATGYNVVDINAAKKKGITVTNIPDYGTNTVAQFTFGLILELCNNIGIHNQAVQEGEWSRSPNFCFWKVPIVELFGKTIGIVGYGSIGKATAEIAKAFGMKVIVYTRTPQKDSERITFVSFDQLLRTSDIVSLHCPLTDENRGIINKDSFLKMKNSAFLINTSRGALVNEKDLREALDNDIIAGAAIDVVSKEPILPENPLLGAKNCIITPHIAWASKEARQRLMDTAIDNLKAFISGNSINEV